ncbi:uncharacterized protein LOC127790234 [Diospyros lotus]|uniref:uncharacterized protein LOC127790234 n=1 Tax=Diospyros lotus TaxID=55363 RepID=UPI002250952F|nr:uncharacterized protein LOC127790234 [Diospyros lotus]
MSPLATTLLTLSLLLLLPHVSRAQERAPHGLAFESPTALPPSGIDFFNPKADQSQQPVTRDPCSSSHCSPLPLAATVASSLGRESTFTPGSGGGASGGVGAGAVAGIVFGFVFVVVLAMGAYYVAVTRRVNLSRSNSVKPDA